MGRWRSTGYGVFVLGTGMGLITNLVTGNPERWPRALQPVSTYSPVIGFGLLLAVGAKAAWDAWRSGYRRPEWRNGNPYPGLVAYNHRWAAVFFGRGRETVELHDRVRGARSATGRFVPVVGPSGSGKSSLVLAGLVPVLGDGFRVVESFTPGNDATSELGTVLGVDLARPARDVLRAARAGEPAPRLDAPLEALNRLRQGSRRLLLVVDQLEEAVTQCVEDDRHAFLALLEALLVQEPRLGVVATLRSDTIGEFQQGPGCDLFRDPLMVNVLGPREIRVVVEEPARLTGTRFADGLVDEIVRDTGGGDALPLLNYLLSDLYRTAARDRHVSWREYEASGGVPGAIARRAEAAARELGPDALPECLDTLLRFVTLAAGGATGGATRQRVPAAALSARQREIVRSFVDARLLTSDRGGDGDGDGVVVYDIAHEALLRQWPPLREHIQLHEENLRRLTELAPLARAWHRSGRRADYLITGGRLADALAWSHGVHAVEPELREFLEAAERNQVGELERRADRTARQALSAVQDAPALARSLALAACTELSCTPLAAYALETAVASGLLQVSAIAGGGTLVAFNRDGRLLVTGGPDGVTTIGPDGERSTVVDLAEAGGATAIATGADGRIALAGRHGAVRMWQDGGTAWRAEVTTQRLTAVAFAGEGLAAAAADGSVTLLDHGGRTVRTVFSGHGPVYHLAVDPADRLVAACADGAVVIWAEGPEPMEVLRGHIDCVLAVGLARDGRIASGSRDRTVRVWDSTGAQLAMHRCRGAVHAVAFDDRGLLAAGDDSGGIRVWSPDGTLLHVLMAAGSPVRSLAFTADGRLAAGAVGGVVRVWDVYGRLATQASDAQADCLAFDPSGRLAIGGPAGLRLAAAAVPETDEPVVAVTFAADGRVAAVTSDGAILLGDGLTQRLTTRDAPFTAVGWTADGYLLTGSADGATHRWTPDGSRTLLRTGSGPVRAVAARPGGMSFVAGDRLYSETIGLHSVIGDHGTATRAVAFAPDGRLATGADDGTVIVWDGDGQRLHAVAERSGPVRALAFDAGGRLAIAAGDGVRVWPHRTEPARLVEIAAQHKGRTLTRQERDAAQLPSGTDEDEGDDAATT